MPVRDARYTAEYKCAIIGAIRSGLSIRQVAWEHDIPVSTVRGWLGERRRQEERAHSLTPGADHWFTFVCRDLGYGIDQGEILGRWTGETDSWGKLTIETDGPTHYLFPDEIKSANRA